MVRAAARSEATPGHRAHVAIATPDHKATPAGAPIDPNLEMTLVIGTMTKMSELCT